MPDRDAELDRLANELLAAADEREGRARAALLEAAAVARDAAGGPLPEETRDFAGTAG